MECKVTCFDRVMNLVKPVPEEKKNELCELITDYGFQDILDFGVENECFSEGQASTLYEGIVMWEDFDGNYYEEDEDKLNDLYERMGVTVDDVRKWQSENN